MEGGRRERVGKGGEGEEGKGGRKGGRGKGGRAGVLSFFIPIFFFAAVPVSVILAVWNVARLCPSHRTYNPAS